MDNKKYIFRLSAEADKRLAEIAARASKSKSEIVRIGLGLAQIAIEERERGNRIIVCQSDGQIIKELVLPD